MVSAPPAYRIMVFPDIFRPRRISGAGPCEHWIHHARHDRRQNFTPRFEAILGVLLSRRRKCENVRTSFEFSAESAKVAACLVIGGNGPEERKILATRNSEWLQHELSLALFNPIDD
jgi:hypothetical protein